MFSVDNMLLEKEKISFYMSYGLKVKHCQAKECKFCVLIMVPKNLTSSTLTKSQHFIFRME